MKRRRNRVRNNIRALWADLKYIAGHPLLPQKCEWCSADKADFVFDILEGINVGVESRAIPRGCG